MVSSIGEDVLGTSIYFFSDKPCVTSLQSAEH